MTHFCRSGKTSSCHAWRVERSSSVMTLIPFEMDIRICFVRESVLFIGTQVSILYTSMYSPAEAATQIRLIRSWGGPPNEIRNSPVNTQKQTQRPHPTAILRPVVAGTRRRLPASTQNPIQRKHPRDTTRMVVTETRRHSRQSTKRRMCAPSRHSGTSGKPLTVSKTRLHRPTR